MRWEDPFDAGRDGGGNLVGTRFMLFDGACGFCTWTARTARSVDRDGLFRFVPYQYLSGADFAAFGVTPERCKHEVVYADRHGTALGGAYAVNHFLMTVPATRRLLTLAALAIVPQLLRIESRLYRFVATHRIAISHVLGTAKYALIDDDAPQPARRDGGTPPI